MNPSDATYPPGYPPGPEGTSRENGMQQVERRIKDVAKDAASSAKEQVRTKLEEGKRHATEVASSTTSALEKVATDLSAEGQETLAQAAAAMSEKLTGLARYVETRSVDDLMRDAQRLAQRNPGLLLAGGVALGLALSRFFKASQERDVAGAGAAPDWTPAENRAATGPFAADTVASTGLRPPTGTVPDVTPRPGGATGPVTGTRSDDGGYTHHH